MDLGAIVNAARRVPGVNDLRAAGERLTISLRVLLPLMESVGATPDLARELRARPAADAVKVIVPTGSGQARIDLGQRQVTIPAALRDAIIVALEQRDAAPAARSSGAALAPATSSIDPSATARLIDASTQTAALAARSGALARALDPQRPPRAAAKFVHTTFDTPLLDDPTENLATALRLRSAVRRSGLFFESHLAAWARGESVERGLHAVRDDLQAASLLASAARTAAQLDLLARDAVQLHGPVWPGQMASIELQRERTADADAKTVLPHIEGAPTFVANLSFNLPRLGQLQVCLRLTGNTIAISLATEDRASIEPELARLGAQLESQGLTPVALQVHDRHGGEAAP